MSHANPAAILEAATCAGTAKTTTAPGAMFIRALLGGAILACATTLAMTATAQTGLGIVGAVIFPIGLVIIVLLGLELVTGGFALVPLALLRRRAAVGPALRYVGVAVAGHLAGCLLYAVAFVATATGMGTVHDNPVAVAIVDLAEAKTLGYASLGASGLLLVIIKAVLCNWMVTLGVILAMTTTDTLGKIVAMWLPITCFFAQGFEHAVVNLFVIPTGMMLGANVGISQWWMLNQLPVLAGNLVGGALLTGFGLWWAHRPYPATADSAAETNAAGASR